MAIANPERVGIAGAVLITGMSRRTLQDLAPSIPGASKPAGGQDDGIARTQVAAKARPS